MRHCVDSKLSTVIGPGQIESIFQNRKVEQGAAALGSTLEVGGCEGYTQSYMDGGSTPLAAIM